MVQQVEGVCQTKVTYCVAAPVKCWCIIVGRRFGERWCWMLLTLPPLQVLKVAVVALALSSLHHSHDQIMCLPALPIHTKQAPS